MSHEQIISISFPRSGHHYLVNCILKYFNENSPTTHGLFPPKEVVVSNSFAYCEFYSHCRTIPCPDPKTVLQKNHDFQIRPSKKTYDPIRIDPNTRYLIQYRGDVRRAIVSEYLRWKSALQASGRPTEQSYSDWLIYWGASLIYWRRFRNKWIRRTPTNSLLICYEDLVHSPTIHIKQALAFIYPGIHIDEDQLVKAISEVGTRTHANPELSYLKYYSFQVLERLVLPFYK